MKHVLRFMEGDPVWVSVPKFNDEVRGYVVGYETFGQVIVQTCTNGKKCTVKAALVKYRYEKGEY